MSNFAVLEQEILRLKKEKEEIRRLMESEICYREDKIKKYQEEMAQCYPNFFEKRINKNFELIHEFPSKGEVQFYEERRYFSHPLANYGNFPIKELAELIKLLFSYQKQEEYKIVTLGGFNDLSPSCYFLIGNDRNLTDYISFCGSYREDIENLNVPYSRKIFDLVVLEAEQNSPKNTLGILCEDLIEQKKISFYETFLEVYNSIPFSDRFNIFHNCFSNYSHYEGIQDTLNFLIHKDDSFLAKMLLSIAIYKKNNGLIYQQNKEVNDLTDEHYQEIFRVLFGEQHFGSMQEMIDKDIPKTLRYVPKDRTNGR